MLDAVIVGAGVGGLVAAIELAASGRRTAVYESASEAGGKVAVANVDGVEFDTGPSLLTLPAAFDDVLGRAGTKLRDEVELVEPDPTFRYAWPDGTTLDLARGHEAMIASVAASLGSTAAREFEAFLRYSRGIWDIAAPEFIEHDAPDFFALLKRGLPGLRSARQIDAFATMHSAIRQRVSSPHLRAILARFATYSGSDPRRSPATLNSIAHVEFGLGAFGVAGGMIELVRALCRVATRLGVQIHLSAHVARIAIEAGRAQGIDLADGRRISARAVISNADVGHLVRSLLPKQARDAVTAPRELSTSGLTLVARARRREGAARRPPHWVVFSDDVDLEVRDLFDDRRPPRAPTVYACAQEVSHHRRGWAEHEPVFVMANAPAGRNDERLPTMKGLEDTMRRYLSLHRVLDADDAIVWRRGPRELEARFPDSGGALYGAASHGWTAAFKRPANAVAAVPGLYLASGSAHPGGGLPLVALSGRAAARAAIKATA